MANQENGNSFKLNIGGPSIILLLTVLGLSVFAILSIRAAYSGLKLARTSGASIAAYYQAEARAEEILFEARELVAANGVNSDIGSELIEIPEVKEVRDSDGELRVVVKIPINEATYIHEELDIGEDGNLQVVLHKLAVTDSQDYSGFGPDVELIEIN